MRGVFYGMTVCVIRCKSKNEWLKLRFHWLFYVVETVMAICCLYGFLLEGFTLFNVDGCILIVMVTISYFIQCYGVVVYISIHLLATVYIFHLVVVTFCVISINTVGYWVATMPRSMILGVGSTWGLKFHRHCYVLVRILRRA
jgi:hypothetical protein